VKYLAKMQFTKPLLTI